jgi:hypothetical protein
MCELPDQARSDGDSGVSGEDSADSAVVERGNGTSRPKTDRKLVNAANKKVSLISILHNYGISPMRNQFSKWSLSITCPFHKFGQERTPSLAYNFESDWFNCFSCGRHGRAVEFIAFKESMVNKRLVTFNEVAKILLSRYEGAEDHDLGLTGDDTKRVEELLFGFSKFIQELIRQYKDDPKEMDVIDKVIWCFDCFLNYAVPGGRITVENLEERIKQAKGLLNDD